MKVKWWAALAAALVLSGCTSEEKAAAPPSAAPVVAQEEAVPAGYFRKPKDGELCKKVDVAALQAVVPGLAAGPAAGVFQGRLKCDFQVTAPSLVSVTIYATMYESADLAAKDLQDVRNIDTGMKPVTLPASKAEALVSGAGVTVLEQNLLLSGGVYATDKAVLTERFGDAVRKVVDDFLIVVRKELQSTTGPSPTAQPQRERRVVSPNAVSGRQFTHPERQYDEIMFGLRIDLDNLDPSPAVAMVYGNSKANNVMIFAATVAVLKTDAGIDATLTRLAREGITMSKPVTEKLDGSTEIRCGEAKLMAFTGALCLWRDNDSLGVAAFPGQKPADVKADFLTLRRLATTG